MRDFCWLVFFFTSTNYIFDSIRPNASPMKCFTDKLPIFEMQEILVRRKENWMTKHAPPVISCHCLWLHLGVRNQKCPPDNWWVNFYLTVVVHYYPNIWILKKDTSEFCSVAVFVLVDVRTVFWCLLLLETYKSLLITYSFSEHYFVQLTMRVSRQRCITTLWFKLPT